MVVQGAVSVLTLVVVNLTRAEQCGHGKDGDGERKAAHDGLQVHRTIQLDDIGDYFLSAAALI